MDCVRVWVALGLTSFIGCGANDNGPPAPEYEKQVFCNGYCESGRRCGEVGDRCEADCVSHYQPSARIRPGVLQNVGYCMQQLSSCESWSSDDPQTSCFDHAKTTVSTTDAMIEYCESASLSYFGCGHWWAVDECLRDMALWSDAALLEAQSCHQQLCEDLAACERAILVGNP